MSSENFPEEENLYSLRGSTKLVGQLYPVLRAKDGSILDGFHRCEADGSWRSEILESIDSEEKKLVARLIANFHRRRIPWEEKAAWINGLATLYQSQGLRVEGERGKAQGSNEIVDRIVKVTGLNWRTVHTYLEPQFKQNAHARNDLSQHTIRSKASEILFNALAGRSPTWAKSVLERYQEELLESPLFRARVLSRVLSMLPKHKRSGASILDQSEQLVPQDVERDGLGFLIYNKEKKDHKGGFIGFVSIEIGNYYDTFIEECPKCICSSCPHADICIERVRPDE